MGFVFDKNYEIFPLLINNDIDTTLISTRNLRKAPQNGPLWKNPVFF